jgi:large subunit ribosomal protein L5
MAKEKEKYISRYKEKYEKEVLPALIKKFNYPNRMAAPRFKKITINIGVGQAIQDIKLLDQAIAELAVIVGQKPVMKRAMRSVAAFKVRTGMPIATMVTLRGVMMYDFWDRLVNIALPRVRDFRGISGKSFDGRGNFTLGIKEHLIFPEIDYSKVEVVKGMNVTFTTSAMTDEEGLALMELMDFPFRKN